MQLRTNFQNAFRMVYKTPVSYSKKVLSGKLPKMFFDLTVEVSHIKGVVQCGNRLLLTILHGSLILSIEFIFAGN